jgi:hypothetical protein
MLKALLSRWYALEAARPAARALAIVGLFVAYAVLLLGARVVPQHDVIVLPLVLFGAFRLSASFPEKRRFVVTFCVALALLVMNIAWLWRVGYAGRHHVFGGVIALSDAHGYFEDAERVLYGLPMNDGGVRRPLSVAVMGGLFRILGGHVRMMMLAVVLGWAAAVAMVTTEISRTHGSVAGSVAGIVFLLFARRYAGLFQPEGIASPIGAIAFCLLWRAASLSKDDTATQAHDAHATRCLRALAGGLLLLTIALLARPGPLTAPLALLAWGVVVMRRRERSRASRVLFVGGVAIAIGWAIQTFVQKATSPNASFNDYPAIFYGMLHNEDHMYLSKAQPWLNDLPEAMRGSATFALVRRELGEHPLLLPIGLVRCFGAHLALPQGLFGFIWSNPDDRVLEEKAVVDRAMREHGIFGPILHWIHELGVYSFLNAIVMALLAIAFIVLLVWSVLRARKKWRADPHVELLLFWLAGIAVSWPVLPPWITEGAQMHATVFVAIVALPSIAFFSSRPVNVPVPVNVPDRTSLAVAIPAAIVALVLIAKVFPARLPDHRECDPDEFRVAADRQARVAFGPRQDATIALADAKQNTALLKKRNRQISEALEAATTTSSEIVPGFDACRGKLYYFIDGTDHFASSPEWAPFRGKLLSPENPVVVGVVDP